MHFLFPCRILDFQQDNQLCNVFTRLAEVVVVRHFQSISDRYACISAAGKYLAQIHSN